MSDLSRSLVDAAAEALCVDHGHSRQEGGMNCRTCARRARAAVVAVLETLARSGQVAWAESLQGLAVEVKESR